MGEAGSVELSAVTKSFGTVLAVDGLDLTVQPGEFLSLLGPVCCLWPREVADQPRSVVTRSA
jgi:ABC-type transporter Mla maintaining outer membrane lipid asymmetry ATPase subunit MlaF